MKTPLKFPAGINRQYLQHGAPLSRPAGICRHRRQNRRNKAAKVKQIQRSAAGQGEKPLSAPKPKITGIEVKKQDGKGRDKLRQCWRASVVADA